MQRWIKRSRDSAGAVGYVQNRAIFISEDLSIDFVAGLREWIDSVQQTCSVLDERAVDALSACDSESCLVKTDGVIREERGVSKALSD